MGIRRVSGAWVRDRLSPNGVTASHDVSAAPLDPAAAVQYHGKFATTSASRTAEFLVLLRVNVPCHDLFASQQTSTATDLAASSGHVDGPCDDTEPVAAKTKNGAWTVRAGERTVRIAADGRVSVGTARRGMPPASGHHGRDSSPEIRGKAGEAGRGKAC